MPPIATTLLGTSANANVCQGFALFPTVGTARAAVYANKTNVSLLNVGPSQVLTFMFSVVTSGSVFAGVCGPAYGIAFTAAGSFSGAALQLSITNDVIQAGLLYGINCGINLFFGLQILELRWIEDGWNSRLVEVWNPALNASVSATLDIIGLVTDLITGKLMFNNSKTVNYAINKSNQGIGGILGVFNIFGQQGGVLAANKGAALIIPEVTLPVNILSALKLIPGIGKVILAIEAVAFQLAIGLVFNIGIPIDVQVTGFSLDSSQYGGLAWSPNNVNASLSSGPEPTNPQSLGVTLQHKLPSNALSFTLSAGLFISVTLVRIFSASITSPTINIPSLLAFAPYQGPYTNTVSNTIGSQQLGFDPLRTPAGGEDEYEVVFEPLDTPA